MDNERHLARPSSENIERLRQIVHLLIRSFLVSGRAGLPAEGKLPFNPLYFHLLGYLREHGATRPSHLAEVLDVAKTTVSTASSALQKRGLLHKLSDPDDGRAHLLALTEDGSIVAQSIYRQDVANMKLLLEQLDQSQHNALLDQLEQVVSGIS
ncbi:MAG: MarR family transcriptional regulator [Pseudomonadota bacterium]